MVDSMANSVSPRAGIAVGLKEVPCRLTPLFLAICPSSEVTEEYPELAGKSMVSNFSQSFWVFGMSSRIFWALAIGDRKSTRLNSSHTVISYAVFCLKKKLDGEQGGHILLYMMHVHTQA